MDQTYLLNFADCVDDLGKVASEGFSLANLQCAQAAFQAIGVECELIDISQGSETAYILLVRKGTERLVDLNALLKYHRETVYNQFTFRRGKAERRRAYYNLGFGDHGQRMDSRALQRRVIDFATAPLMQQLRVKLSEMLGPSLMAEGLHFYDVRRCRMGFQGNTGRKLVLVCLGAVMPLHFQWYNQGNATGVRIKLSLQHGDLCICSAKAAGYDWRRCSVPTLRHAAGHHLLLE
jgi:hypothetical protein